MVEMAVLRGDLHKENILYKYDMLVFYDNFKEGLFFCTCN